MKVANYLKKSVKKVSITQLIRDLKKCESRGGKTVVLSGRGTLSCPEDGNFVLLTTESQI